MNKPIESSVNKTVDTIQRRLTDYAYGLDYHGLTPEAIHAAKVRMIDTLGALIAGFHGEPCRVARNVAVEVQIDGSATIIGTRIKTTPDMAAFVNSTTSRYVEMNDFYHRPGRSGAHPSDIITPLLAVAEHAHVSGREFLTSLVLGYEIYLRVADATDTPGFDCANFVCLATAAAAGKLLALSASQLAHCISMAVVPNNALNQGRIGYLSMWKAVAAGQAGRAGVFAALMARQGLEGPHLPFEGKAGWCEHVARGRFSLHTMGGNGTPFKVQDSLIKQRSSCAATISSILAAEKAAVGLKNMSDVTKVLVETYGRAIKSRGSGEHVWNPDTRETADHSIPYGVAAAVMDGRITPRSFNDSHLSNPQLRALMQTIEVVENPEFTQAFDRPTHEHRTRVTIVTKSGERHVGEVGGGNNDMSAKLTNSDIEEKFRELTQDFLSVSRTNAILDRLWNLEDIKDVATIPPDFVLH